MVRYLLLAMGAILWGCTLYFNLAGWLAYIIAVAVIRTIIQLPYGVWKPFYIFAITSPWFLCFVEYLQDIPVALATCDGNFAGWGTRECGQSNPVAGLTVAAEMRMWKGRVLLCVWLSANYSLGAILFLLDAASDGTSVLALNKLYQVACIFFVYIVACGLVFSLWITTISHETHRVQSS